MSGIKRDFINSTGRRQGDKRDFRILSITVPEVSLKRGPNGGSQFAVFELKVQAQSSGQPLQWKHHRRYTDFLELHNRLRRSNIHDLPDLPGKRLMGNLSEPFLQQRRVDLQIYLQNTMASSEASKCPSFMSFIGAVQFIDTSDQDNGENTMTDFPYTMRSGRYGEAQRGVGSKPSRRGSRRGHKEDTCNGPCVIS